jgi:hypothetical protein
MATARRLIFLEFLKASIADLITLLFSSLQNSEGDGDSNSCDSFADPCHFARVNVKISKEKIDKRLLNRLRCSGIDFLPKFVNNGESRRFFGRC